MFEPSNEAGARILCRLYAHLFEAGPHAGATLDESIAAGVADAVRQRSGGAAQVLRGVLEERLFDQVGSRNGVKHYALPPKMQEHMAREISPGAMLADRVRQALSQADRGEDVGTGAFLQFEKEIRTGLR